MLVCTITDCSLAHITPLSNDLESITDETAFFTSHDLWNNAGTLPAPTPIAGLPLEYALRTMPGPPVASIMSVVFITSFVSSKEGVSIQPIMPSGAPALTAASSTIRAASIVQFLALGCGLKIIPLRVFNASNALNIAVDVGFVVGITAAITPIGSAITLVPKASSREITPQVLLSLYLLYIYSAA